MPKNISVDLPPNVWTEITTGDVSGAVMFINSGGHTLNFQATADADAPATLAGSIPYQPNTGDRGALSDLFPGVSGAVRLWGYAPNGGIVAVQHG